MNSNNRRIKKAWLEGWTVREIAVLVGVSMRRVCYVRAELNLPRRKRGRRKQ